jgi:hypothetical protein
MLRTLLLITLPILIALPVLITVPAAALADPPTDAELEAASAALPMPSLEARLKARAAAWRTVNNAAATLGLGELAVRQATDAAVGTAVIVARNDAR